MRTKIFKANAFPRKAAKRKSEEALFVKTEAVSQKRLKEIVAHFNRVGKMLFKDKVCIVTGAAVGLGRAFCEQLLKQGAFVRRKVLIESGRVH